MISFRVFLRQRLLRVISIALLVKHVHGSSARRGTVLHIETRLRDMGFGNHVSATHQFQQRRLTASEISDASSPSSRINMFAESHALSACDALRGGSIDRRDASSIELFLRNIVRSILTRTKGSTTLHSTLQAIFHALESVTGSRLLPEVEAEKKSKKGKKRKKSNRTASVNADSAVKETEKKHPAPKKAKNSSTATKMQLKRELKATNPMYRIQQELKAFVKDPPEHLSVAAGKNIRIWIVTVEGIGIYEGETFRLRIQFPTDYPTVPPSVYFLPPNIPLHEHVYTNGDICLSLLGKDWRPTMTAQSIAHSILSILASASSKSLPMDNARHAQNQPGQYQADWVYHDDNC